MDCRQLALKRTHSKAVSSSSKRIFIAVPMPDTCSFPHSLHLSHPTQSMMRETLRKWDLNWSLRICCQQRNDRTHHRVSTTKHGRLVKTLVHVVALRQAENRLERVLCSEVVLEQCLPVAGRRSDTDVVSFEVRRRPGYSSQQKNRIKVDIRQTFRMGCQAGDKALQIRRLLSAGLLCTYPFPSGLIEILVTDVDGDGRMKACCQRLCRSLTRDHPVVHSLLLAHVRVVRLDHLCSKPFTQAAKRVGRRGRDSC